MKILWKLWPPVCFPKQQNWSKWMYSLFFYLMLENFNFVTSSLLPWATISFPKGVNSHRKEFAFFCRSKFLPLRVELTIPVETNFFLIWVFERADKKKMVELPPMKVYLYILQQETKLEIYKSDLPRAATCVSALPWATRRFLRLAAAEIQSIMSTIWFTLSHRIK